MRISVVTNYVGKVEDKRFIQNTLQNVTQSRKIALEQHKLLCKKFLTATKK